MPLRGNSFKKQDNTRRTGRSAHLREELREFTSLNLTAAAVQSVLHVEALSGGEELDGVLPSVVLAPCHLHDRLPCTPPPVTPVVPSFPETSLNVNA
jgi:hypothetical protein